MRTIRIMFGSNGVFDMQIVEGFDYQRLLQGIRADGYFLNVEGVFIPLHAINMIMVLNPAQVMNTSEAQGMTRQ